MIKEIEYGVVENFVSKNPFTIWKFKLIGILSAILILLQEEKVQEGNSLISILIIITVLNFEKNNVELSLKRLYLELGQFSDVTIRKDINRLCKDKLLSIETPEDDLRTKILSSTSRLKSIELKIDKLCLERQ